MKAVMLCSLQFPAFVRIVRSEIWRNRPITSVAAFPVSSSLICMRTVRSRQERQKGRHAASALSRTFGSFPSIAFWFFS